MKVFYNVEITDKISVTQNPPQLGSVFDEGVAKLRKYSANPESLSDPLTSRGAQLIVI